MKKKIIVWSIIALIIILLIPYPYQIKDGGSIEYRAVLYSVNDYHAMMPNDAIATGIVVKILGMKVYDNTNFDEL